MVIESRNYDTVFSPQTFRSSLMIGLVILQSDISEPYLEYGYLRLNRVLDRLLCYIGLTLILIESSESAESAPILYTCTHTRLTVNLPQ